MKLSDWLTSTGMTQAALAERSGLSEATISRLVRGVNRPDWRAIDALAVATDGAVTANDFMAPVSAEGAAA